MKPYPKYKPTNIEWIGEIPKHWEVKRLKYVAVAQPSNVDKKSYEDELSVSLCNYVDVYKNDYIDDSISFMQATATQNEIEKFKLKIGDVIITKDSETREEIAIPALVKYERNDLICGYHLTQIRADNISVIGDYIFRLFQTKSFNSNFESSANGVTRYALSSETIAGVYVLLPPVEEQRAIANFLYSKTKLIDDSMKKKQQLIELLKAEKTAVTDSAITKGINPKAKMKPSGIELLGEVPKHWEVKRLKYVVEINPSQSNYEFEDSSDKLVAFLPMEKVSEEGEIAVDNFKEIKSVSKGFTYFEKNDIIVAKITPCFENGKGALLDNLPTDFGFGSTEFHVLRPIKNQATNKFIRYLTKTDMFMNVGEAFMSGAAGQKRVPTSFLENLSVALPPISEQEEIVAHIEATNTKINTTISKLEKEIELLGEYRTALISEVVTGKVDIRGEKNLKPTP